MALAVLAVSAGALTLTDIAMGPVPGTTAIYPASVTSGDFTYTGNPLAPIGGDGVDDAVFWSFDFTSHPSYHFYVDQQFGAAILTLTLIPRDGLIFTDSFGIIGVPASVAPVIPALPLNVPSTLTFDLLDYYTSDQIVAAFIGGGGILNMHYNDDAHLTFARLELETAPEPGTLLLLGAGLLGLTVLRRRA